MVTFLGSLVQSCCGEGGTLQTNITGVCGECSWYLGHTGFAAAPGMCGECLQCMDHTGFAPAHGAYAFPVFTAQAPGSSAGVLSKAGLGFVHFPDLSCSGSGSWVFHKGTELVVDAFCALPRSEQLRQPGAWRAHSPDGAVHLSTSLVPAARFPGCSAGAPSQVCPVSPLGS